MNTTECIYTTYVVMDLFFGSIVLKKHSFSKIINMFCYIFCTYLIVTTVFNVCHQTMMAYFD